jgi:hypothetical protein
LIKKGIRLEIGSCFDFIELKIKYYEPTSVSIGKFSNTSCQLMLHRHDNKMSRRALSEDKICVSGMSRK